MRSRTGCWSYGDLFAYEPGSLVWRSAARRVVSNVLRQADFACRRSTSGCRGFYGYVQELTAQGPYVRAHDQALAHFNCVPPVYACNTTSYGYCVQAGTAFCPGATHGFLRRLFTIADQDSPTRHVPCHAKPGAKKQCKRPNETSVHYVSKPEGAVMYYTTPDGKRDGSSAPGYYHPRCATNDTRKDGRLHWQVRPWTRCAQARAHVATPQVQQAVCNSTEPYADEFVRRYT